MRKKTILAFAAIGILILALFLGDFIYTRYYLPSTFIPSQPLSNVEFPQERAKYPSGWPDELIFPSEFTLADSSSGTLHGGIAMGWSLKLKYQGIPLDAEKLMTEIFRSAGWTIVESDHLDSGGILLLVQRGKGNGILVMDNDLNNPMQTLILASIFQ